MTLSPLRITRAKGKNRACDQKYMNEDDMIKQFKQYIIDHESDIKLSYTIQKQISQHQKILLYYLPIHGINTGFIAPLRSYADYVLSSSSTKLVTELVEGLNTKFLLNNGQVTSSVESPIQV